MEFYFDVWWEAFWLAGVMPMKSELVIYLMKGFGGYNLYLAAGIATFGILCGAALNWWAGSALSLLRQKRWVKLKPETYDLWSQRLSHIGILLVLFAWTPVGQVILLTMGFFKVPFSRVMAMATFGTILHYGFDLGLMR